MSISKDNLNKISDYLWEIPRSFRSDMKVPVRIYASEKMLGEIFRDRSLEQLVNVSTLHGIQRYALAMPDIHEGYGFPVGGVAAFSLENGIISPGGIGYDINCLHPDSVVSLFFGANIKVGRLARKWPSLNCLVVNKKDKSLTNQRIINFFSRQENGSLFNIKTRFGFSIKVTGDHPLYTVTGMKKAESLAVGDKLVLYPFSGIEYEEPSDDLIFDKSDLTAALSRLNLPNRGNRWGQIINWLWAKGLASLRYNSPQLPYLIKLFGLVLGDGYIGFVGKERRGQLVVYGRKEDLEDVKADLKTIGLKAVICSRQRHHIFRNRPNKTYEFWAEEHSLHLNSSALVLVFYLLGAPLGDKVNQEFEVPAWLRLAPAWQKRLFLASFFGAEMSTPRTITKFNMAAPTVNINKSEQLKENGLKFLNQLRAILLELGVESSTVKIVAGLGRENKTGEKTIGLRFQILSRPANLISFFKKVGFECSREKRYLACLAIAYLYYKSKVNKLRLSIRNAVRLLYNQGVAVSALRQQFADQYAPAQFVEHSIWSKRELPRIAYDFPSFEEFVTANSYGKAGLVIDEVESIERKPYQGLVYDFTVNHPDHNFIANSFVVSNCGVRLLRSEKEFKEVQPHLEKLGQAIYAAVPSGVGRGGRLVLKGKDFDKVLERGARRAVEMGYGKAEDLKHLESEGMLENADASLVSENAKSRGRDQLGTMGAGNHFVEVEVVEAIFDEEEAKRLGIFKDQVVVLIHTGSRGLGHQIATDYIRVMMRVMPKYGISLPDRELACAPFDSPEGQDYFYAMAAGANFAWANRQVITWEVRKAWEEVLGGQGGSLDIVYDVAHNIAKIEEYESDLNRGEKIKMVVHRKGATRSFPGQPVLIPGSMGTGSYLLVGQEKAMEESFGSTCHGAGRRMSRTQAKREVRGSELKQELNKRGIVVNTGSLSGLAEEAPRAYKNVDEVVEIVHQAGIAKKVVRFKPVAVIKG
jgi:tRNA-splicing ligase RtcB